MKNRSQAWDGILLSGYSSVWDTNLALATPGGWDPIPGTDSETSGTVWHHTDARGLLGIITGKSFWASSPLSLNDASEVTYGVEVFTEAWESLRSGFSPETQALVEKVLAVDFGSALSQNVYFLSATACQDSLNQWQGYSGAQGYAIEIDMSQPLVAFEPGFDPTRLRTPTTSPLSLPSWRKVIYERSGQLAIAVKVLQFVCEHFTESHNPLNTLQAQNTIATSAVRLKSDPERFRTGKRGLIPFIELVTAPDHTSESPENQLGFSLTKDRRLPIRSVVCGPVSDSDRPAVIEAVQRLLAANGYDEVSVSASAIPYRF